MSDKSQVDEQHNKQAIQDLFSSMQWIRIEYPFDFSYTTQENISSILQNQISETPIYLYGDVIYDSTNSNEIQTIHSYNTSSTSIYPNLPIWMQSVISLHGVSLLSSTTTPEQVTSLQTHCISFCSSLP